MPIVKQSGERFDFKDYENLTSPELVKKEVLPDIAWFYEWNTESK